MKARDSNHGVRNSTCDFGKAFVCEIWGSTNNNLDLLAT